MVACFEIAYIACNIPLKLCIPGDPGEGGEGGHDHQIQGGGVSLISGILEQKSVI